MLISVYHAEAEVFYDWLSYSFNCQIIYQLDCYLFDIYMIKPENSPVSPCKSTW